MRSILILLFLVITQVLSSGAGVTLAAVRGKGFIVGRPGNPVFIIPEPYPPTVLGVEFNEGSGTTLATSFGPSLTMSGAMNWVTGASGSGSAIGTTGDETATTDSAVTFGSNKITVCAWIKAANWSSAPGVIVETTGYLASNANGFRLYMTGDGNVLTMGMTGDTVANKSEWQLSDTLVNASWQHIACVFDGSVGGGGALTFYYNGVQTTVGQATADRDGTSNFTDVTITIGSTASLDINIDDLRIYSSALNAAQVLKIYQNPR